MTRDRWQSWLLLSLLTATAVIAFSHRLVLHPFIDQLKTQFLIDDTAVSLLLGPAFALSYGIAALPLGMATDRIPRIRLAAAMLVLWSGATAACSLAPTYGALFAARIAVGVGEAALIPIAVSIITDSFTAERRGMAIGIFMTGVTVGYGTAFAASGVVYDLVLANMFHNTLFEYAGAPWRQTILILSVPGPLVALLLLAFPEPQRQGSAQRVIEAVSSFRPGAVIAALICGAIALMAFADSGIFAWTAALLTREHGMATAAAAKTIGAITIAASIGGTLLGGALADRALRRGGVPGQLRTAGRIALLGLFGSLIFAATMTPSVLLALALWVGAVTAAPVAAYAVLTQVIPASRIGITTAAMTATIAIAGLGAGPPTVALLNQQVFAGALSLGVILALMATMSSALAFLLFGVAAKRAAMIEVG